MLITWLGSYASSDEQKFPQCPCRSICLYLRAVLHPSECVPRGTIWHHVPHPALQQPGYIVGMALSAVASLPLGATLLLALEAICLRALRFSGGRFARVTLVPRDQWRVGLSAFHLLVSWSVGRGSNLRGRVRA